MIQRIQTLYLLIATALLVAALCLPLGQFVGDDSITVSVFKPLGITLHNGDFYATWGLFGILLLSGIILLATIFLFKNRMLQIRMTVFSMILLVGYYIVFGVFLYMLLREDAVGRYQIGWSLCLPAISIILSYLAFRAIYRDEVMVRAADRLRR
ncbi:MAG: DUF4293 domain-containing protein [Mediterranea sp.]|jgi:hypothetical protein|nr:DUF4293 domain-containing protein [Mediterranea sp.]